MAAMSGSDASRIEPSWVQSCLPDGFQSVIVLDFLPLGKRFPFEYALNDELRPIWPVNLVKTNVPEQRPAERWLIIQGFHPFRGLNSCTPVAFRATTSNGPRPVRTS